ncbi:transglycosylase SLT domain-containing protein [Parabacteroides sp. Marseille-P3160]|uniref:transglycosylase SLT domain-containing protein n=1 Tax=Parabacteroides sp. Marseille-P3160 TaxID=1917887 RepID=UPI0009BAFBEC|nr:transglycosylase SLT domain-containing protein [Parabacteroides sp. Marseille-P3160]
MKKAATSLLFPLLLFLGCTPQKQQEQVDLPQIKSKGEITAVTLYSSTSYFQYKAEPMGYEYDLIRDFAESQGLKLNIKVAENSIRLVEMLQNGEADVVAYPIQIENKLKEKALYCGLERQSTQVIVQRADRGDTILTDVTQLIGKEIYVKGHTKQYDRLLNLNVELGGGLLIKDIEKDTVTTEDLIEMVSKGEIPYTVSDDDIARLNKTYYWNINVDLQISFFQRSSWIVRKSSPELAKAINAWASDQTHRKRSDTASKRYFEMSKRALEYSTPEIRNGKISAYDSSFRKHAHSLGWKWQLLASIAYQESHFNPQATSWAGAQGIMGIMPRTARALGASPGDLNEADASIRLGVECLRRFRNGFKNVTHPEEKIKFTLASYNAGIGHIYDAQQLARKYGRNPYLWEDVSEYVRLKNDPVYYNDPVCKHGYLRGSETVSYVKEVMARFRYYRKQVPH